MSASPDNLAALDKRFAKRALLAAARQILDDLIADAEQRFGVSRTGTIIDQADAQTMWHVVRLKEWIVRDANGLLICRVRVAADAKRIVADHNDALAAYSRGYDEGFGAGLAARVAP